MYDLKATVKEKTAWRCYDIKRLYINESLTPEKRRLLYKTKKMMREKFTQFEKSYVWTYKGCVFLRVDAENASRIEISSEKY